MADLLPNEVDIVVAGGGTTGVLVASRLAKADSSLSIVVLEQGINTEDNPLVVNPALYLRNIGPDSKTASFYKSEPSWELSGRESVVPTGCCLGGGSSINFMVYSRPQAIDFDDWDTQGWNGEEMMPFFRKYERFQDSDPAVDSSTHGYHGEISVSAGTNAQARFQDDFFQACADLGIQKSADVQNFKTSNAVGKWNMWIDKDSGLRQDVPHRFLFPLLSSGCSSLKVFTEVKVIRILFDDKNKATGLEYLVDGHTKSTGIINARKFVIVAAGAFGSPQILERSGLGDKRILSKLGIPVISDLPGVGQNYQDHNVVFYPYKSTASKDETLDGIFSGRLGIEAALEQKMAHPKRHILGWNGLDCVGKLRPSETELESFDHSLKQAWQKDFENRPEKPLMLMSTIAGYTGDHSSVEPGQYFSLGAYTPYPYSRGSIHITGKSVSDEPKFNCGYLSNPIDLEKLLWGYKVQREISRRLAHYRGPLEVGHPKFPADSKADYATVDKASKAQGSPVPIIYSKKDDDAIRSFIREHVHTTWHSLGTCCMKDRKRGGVVDNNLNVYGVRNLKVIDLSICPSNVSANTYATALAVGEKASSIIARDIGIPYSI